MSAQLLSSRLGTPDATGRCLCSLLSAWFPGGATISRPYVSCTPAPHRTGQADFPHPALHSDIRCRAEGVLCPCSTSYPCQVCAHRNFTPCIVPVFLPSRASECRNLHSTVISRFNAKPVPVPLRSRRLRAFFYVGPTYSDDTAPKSFSARQDCSIIVVRLDAV